MRRHASPAPSSRASQSSLRHARAAPPAARTIEVRVEQLRLEGFTLSRIEATRLGAALERELTSLIARARQHEPPRPADGAAPAGRRLDVHLVAGASPAAWGRQIARQLYRSITSPLAAAVAGVGALSAATEERP